MIFSTSIYKVVKRGGILRIVLKILIRRGKRPEVLTISAYGHTESIIIPDIRKKLSGSRILIEHGRCIAPGRF